MCVFTGMRARLLTGSQLTLRCRVVTPQVQKGLLAQISGRDELLAGLRQENEQLRRRLTTMDTQCEAVPRSDDPSQASGSSHGDAGSHCANAEGSADGSTGPTAGHDQDSGSGGAAAPQDEAATGAGGGEGAQAATAGGGSGVDMLKRHNRELLRDLALCRRELGMTRVFCADRCVCCVGMTLKAPALLVLFAVLQASSSGYM